MDTLSGGFEIQGSQKTRKIQSDPEEQNKEHLILGHGMSCSSWNNVDADMKGIGWFKQLRAKK